MEPTASRGREISLTRVANPGQLRNAPPVRGVEPHASACGSDGDAPHWPLVEVVAFGLPRRPRRAVLMYLALVCGRDCARSPASPPADRPGLLVMTGCADWPVLDGRRQARALAADMGLPWRASFWVPAGGQRHHAALETSVDVARGTAETVVAARGRLHGLRVWAVSLCMCGVFAVFIHLTRAAGARLGRRLLWLGRRRQLLLRWRRMGRSHRHRLRARRCRARTPGRPGPSSLRPGTAPGPRGTMAADWSCRLGRKISNLEGRPPRARRGGRRAAQPRIRRLSAAPPHPSALAFERPLLSTSRSHARTHTCPRPPTTMFVQCRPP